MIVMNERSKKRLMLIFGITAILIMLFLICGLTVQIMSGMVSCNINHCHHDKENESKENVQLTLKDSVYNAIFVTRVEHPDIVFAQAILESGHMKDKVFTDGNNLFGMKVPSRRPTLAVGVIHGHAKFNTWMDSVKDYAIWQSIYCRGLAREEYFNYLDKVYSENKNYVKILKTIISRVNSFNMEDKMSLIELQLQDTLKN